MISSYEEDIFISVVSVEGLKSLDEPNTFLMYLAIIAFPATLVLLIGEARFFKFSHKPFISVLFLCLSIVKTLKRRQSLRLNSIRRRRSTKRHNVDSLSNGVVRERPKEEENTCVSIISSGVVNVSFDDIEDMNMIDSGSVATVSDDEEGTNKAVVGEIVTSEKIVSIKRSVSFKDELLENRNEQNLSL